MAYNYQRRNFSAYKTYTNDIVLRTNIEFMEVIEAEVGKLNDYEFSFYQQSREFPEGNVDWNSLEQSRQWRKSLHSFDYLQDPDRPFSVKFHLINHWIVNTTNQTEDAWDSYVVATRICNWIKFILKPGICSVAPSLWLESLYAQISWLEKNPGKQVQTHFPIRTAKALYFAGMYYHGSDANRWLKTGINLLNEQIQEQVLEDGGHVDRSPMSHSIVIADLLDVVSLSLGSVIAENNFALDFYLRTTRKMLDFLFDIVMPDGEIPLLNDSAFGVAYKPAQLFAYAKSLIGYRKRETPHVMRAIEKKESGYFVVKGKGDMLIVDIGENGQDFQPGQSHCDTLSYELCFDQQRIIVDSGMKDFELTEERCYARSTEAHNTISVNDQEQSEIWGATQVGRKAKSVQASMELKGGVVIEASHNGYDNLKKGPVRHQRKFYVRNDTVTVSDSLTGDGKHLVKSYIHLHPELHVQLDKNVVSVRKHHQSIALIEISGEVDISIKKGKYFPEFGKAQGNIVIQMSCVSSMPVQLEYTISKVNETSE